MKYHKSVYCKEGLCGILLLVIQRARDNKVSQCIKGAMCALVGDKPHIQEHEG